MITVIFRIIFRIIDFFCLHFFPVPAHHLRRQFLPHRLIFHHYHPRPHLHHYEVVVLKANPYSSNSGVTIGAALT